MHEIAQTLWEFWNGFGITAYPMNGIPDGAELPYIVYNVQQGDTFGNMTDFAKIYYKGKNSEQMFIVADKIKDTIGKGVCLRLSKGNIIIYEPTIQLMEDTDTSLACYLSFSIDYNL